PKEWLEPVIDGKRYRRETNTMPQWAGSCWYFLRFIDPRNNQRFVDAGKEKAWMPIDLYVGGAEHAVLHLLYSRFWHKVLFDRGHVSTPEPFRKLVNQGMILGENGEKMSKARGNVVNPDDVVREHGAESLWLFEQFVLILSPFAPHIAEELWQLLGHGQTLAYEQWPKFDEALTKDAEIEIPVQINGKLRGTVVVLAESDQATIVAAARADERIAGLLAG